MLALSMMLGGRGTLPVYNVSISSNSIQWVKSVDAPSLPSSSPIKLVIQIGAGVEVQSSSISYGAIHLDALCGGSEVYILNRGYILGKGGGGGAGGSFANNGVDGEAGGPGIRADFVGFLTLENASGFIYGGGGGGGGGSGSAVLANADGGGGGGGAGGGKKGSGTTGGNDGTAGTAGRLGLPGSGGTTVGVGASGGGNGGTYGSVGVTASDADFTGGVGGAAGKSIHYNAGSVITWVSGQTNILGPIST